MGRVQEEERMSNNRFTKTSKKGPKGTEGYFWKDSQSGDRGHTGSRVNRDGSKDYHEKNHKTGGIAGWIFNPTDSSKNRNTGNKQGKKEAGR